MTSAKEAREGTTSMSTTMPVGAQAVAPEAAAGEAVPAAAPAADEAAVPVASEAAQAAAQATAEPAASEATQAATPAAAPTFAAPAPSDDIDAPAKGGAVYFFVKRAFDILFSLLVCVVLAIPVAIICLAIVIDSPGKPFFRQERVGRYGRKIKIIKLRTMVPDAHTNPERYMTPEQLATWQREQKVENDPRLTRMGKWLRRLSLDELPQFINVLVGDLSVIGPRPVTEAETYEFGSARDEFLSCKPGITGWWQVVSRNNATWEDGGRQLLELFYVRHQSFALDLRIFARTFSAMRKGQ